MRNKPPAPEPDVIGTIHRYGRTAEGGSVNAANSYWSRMRVCPACRGYNLERSWCDVCDRKGVIPKSSANVRVEATPLAGATDETGGGA